jgi:3-deoxy-manno-octulosonate cytidylyltransferase (CMP-KDO synthetase)
MATLAVIPARIGATRLPRKPLRLLGGEPLVIRVWQRAAALGVADLCVIATDSDEIAQVASDAGAECVLTSGSHPSGTDRVAEVARTSRYSRFDTILNIQGDEPFVAADAVWGAVELVRSGRFALGTACVPLADGALDSPDVVKVVCADDGRALYFSRAAIPFARDAGDMDSRSRIARQHIGVYAYRRDALLRWVSLPVHPLEMVEKLEQLRPLAAGMDMGVAAASGPAPGGIDTNEDLDRANEHWDAFTAGTM